MSQFIATPAEGKEILRVLESSAAKGGIQLLYTRRPDAYASYMTEAADARVFVSRDGDRIVGTCARLVREVYVGGEPVKAAYLCGLKKDAAYRGSVGFGRQFLRALQRADIGLYYCSVIADNAATRQMFGKKRRTLAMAPLTAYTTHILRPKAGRTRLRHPFTFRQATPADTSALLAFLNDEGRNKDLFPVVRSLEAFSGLGVENFYLLLEGETLVAAAALWDQSHYKQYVVKEYTGWMKLARAANPLLSLLGYVKLPRENIPLTFPFLSFLVSRGDAEAYYRVLLCEMQREIAKTYRMFVIGLPREHPAASVVGRMRGIRFDSILYRITFPESLSGRIAPNLRNLQPECGWL